MKTFKCDCQNHQILFFESKFCISCNQVVGIDDDFNKVEPYSFDTNNGYYFKADKRRRGHYTGVYGPAAWCISYTSAGGISNPGKRWPH